MAQLFKFPPIVYLLWKYSQGLVDDTLNLKFQNFAQIKITIPGIDEQHRIAEVLYIADNEIEKLKSKLAALENKN
jgi:type I restriction enzyme S subunit